MIMTYIIEVTRAVVSYYTREGVTPTGGRYGGEWMDGDRRDLERPRAELITPDAEDIEDYADCPDPAVAWAVNYLRPLASFEPSGWPIQDAEHEHSWLSSSEDDALSGPGWRVTETSVYLRGDFTPEQRAEVFREVTKH